MKSLARTCGALTLSIVCLLGVAGCQSIPAYDPGSDWYSPAPQGSYTFVSEPAGAAVLVSANGGEFALLVDEADEPVITPYTMAFDWPGVPWGAAQLSFVVLWPDGTIGEVVDADPDQRALRFTWKRGSQSAPRPAAGPVLEPAIAIDG